MFIHPYDPTEDILAKIIIPVRLVCFQRMWFVFFFTGNLMILCKPLTLLV